MKFNSEIELTQWALDALSLWLFLDYDGTLADFAPTPDQLHQNRKVIDLLHRLEQKQKFRMTVISGRRLQDIRILLPISGIFLCGTYGIELLTPTGETIHRVDYDEVRPALEIIKPKWTRLISGRKGFFLEDKGWTLAIHARFADDTESDEVLTSAHRVIDEEKLAKRFRVLGGYKFLEIVPLLGSKRETVIYLFQKFSLPGAKCVYIGDDDKDEEAFPVIHGHNGVAIKVWQPSQSFSPTEADFVFDSPRTTIHWLESLTR